ncbi:MAG: hypothetical protein GY949_00995 [Gammaproteobacteria bacterium]|nr:hypothetical protein [Gammaproteobacteria bacterium]
MKALIVTLVTVLASFWGCASANTELLDSIENSVRGDPFILDFQKSMERAFGCSANAKGGSQQVSVFTSLYSVLGPDIAKSKNIQLPTLYVVIDCHSALVSRVFLDFNLWRGSVETVDQFHFIEPEMIQEIRFETSDSFDWYVSKRRVRPSGDIDLASAAISAPIWTAFAKQVAAMFPSGCRPLDKSTVFYGEGNQKILAGVPYNEFSSTLGCPKPGHHKPGFSFKGYFFPTKGFVLPVRIDKAGAYVD